MARKLTWVASGCASLAVFYACSSPTPSAPRGGGGEMGGSTGTTGGSTAGGSGGTIGTGGAGVAIAGGTGGKATGGTGGASGGTGGASGGAAGAMMAGGTGGGFPDPANADFTFMDTGDQGCSSANGCAGSSAINLVKAGEAYREFWEHPTVGDCQCNSVQIPSMTSCQFSPKFPDMAAFKGVPILGGLRGHALDTATKFNDFGDDYGERVRGFIKAPATGNYTFWVDSDNASQLYISIFIPLGSTPPASLPSKATGVAFVNDFTVQGTFNDAGQKSQAVAMVMDNYYYFDFFHRAGGGTADHWEIRWTKPGQSKTFETVPASVLYSVTPTPGSGPACPGGTGGTGSGGAGSGGNAGAAGSGGT